ncbi:P-loop containing nucleoside triphosphate hydrolase protein [Setomelanomma holmii]|uniref:P-loop containing nucleoside triphosphate hydrolase protein n=1 Tax=Setomelanomma holmii TaxID=210430 RepID=A0A9P4LLW2_9PLEO|nr:P-loop containing nucleoside triphosphate hydrolase protein [Setomelanomma holmii]
MQKETSSWQMLISSETTLAIEFANLWMAFRPGDHLFALDYCLGEPFITRLRSMELKRHELPDRSYSESWYIMTEKIDCNGDYVSYQQYNISIYQYDGCRALADLSTYPLRYHKEEARIRELVSHRGRQWLSLVGIHHRSYDGVAHLRKASHGLTPATAESSVRGGIIIDSKEYNTNVAPGAVYFIPGAKAIKGSELKEDTFTDDEILLCSSRVHAFSLVAKRWGIFYVKHIKDAEFNTTAFDSLVLSQHNKDLIRSLVNDHENKHSSFDDLIKGKGKGLIFLLHGPPGVGKTLTAESLADFTKRPLYTLGGAELGTNSAVVEGTLRRALELASKWNALVLVDEADVFMEQRNNYNLAHSELVAVLLRTLEQFEGVMFLTTNRVGSIDAAFKSRIHLSLYYPQLSADARSSIWTTFIVRGSGSVAPPWLTQELLDRLTYYEINGRQIKNTIRMACSIAANEQRELRASDIMKGLHAFFSFESDFNTSGRRKKFAKTSSKKRRAHISGYGDQSPDY